MVAMLQCILREAGYKVGTYTSPHLLSLRERISVDGQPISGQEFDALVSGGLTMARAAMGQQFSGISHFEMMTALALQHSKQQQVDIAVVEAGLGGARDATNVFGAPQLKAAVLTAVGLEHQAALGGSLKSIATAKAGIMKAGRPLVLGAQPHPEAKRILCQRAAELECRIYDSQAEIWPRRLVVERDTVWEECSIFLLNGECADAVEMRLGLVGAHQRDNAVTAASAALALRQQGFGDIGVPAILAGLSQARLPGRFQVGRLKAPDGGGGCWLVLDGAHTGASAAALADTLRRAFPQERHRLALILASADDKDHGAVAAALRQANPALVVFTTVSIAGSMARAAPPGMLAAHWQAAGMAQQRPVRMREMIQASLAAAVEKAQAELGDDPEAVICITGSMHAVAEALRADLIAQ